MPNPNKSHRQQPKDTEEDDGAIPPSKNLWIGNLTTDTSDLDLKELFGRYGVVETVTNYATKNYAFIYYKRVEDARSAKEGLQNALLRGNSIRIEFARPAKPAKNLWVGGISSTVTKEQLEDEFSKWGKIEEFKFLRDRNSALIEYCKLEDALAAVKNVNGRRLGGELIRVDFLRSQSRRDNWSEFHDTRDGHFNNRGTGPSEPYRGAPDAVRSFPESFHFGHKRHPPSQHSGGRREREGQPSKVLWVGYPPGVQIDEQMLHNAMILFGEIERIKSYPSRNYSFVEFRSVDEARRAKEGLQGHLFNDPRIHIMFSSSELAPPKDSPGFYTGGKGSGPDMFFHDPSFGPGPMDFYGHNRPMDPNNFPGPLGPNMPMRPFGPLGGFDQVLSNPEMFNELAGLLQNFQEANPNNPMGQNWRRPSPAPGILPSPAPGMGPLPPMRPMPGTWEESEPRAFQRESKRSRIDGPSLTDGPARMFHDQEMGGDQFFGYDPQVDRGASTPVAQGRSRHSPLGVTASNGETYGQVRPDSDLCWRGVIAKGGTPVCHARCVGKGLDTQLPEIVNCSARTGLDMLAKHYNEASGFTIVYFLPDSEEDFASYTEFLRYLGAKNRAGVAKFDDGTTLFLVPPSDFLTNVLNVSGPERLYGVVLKLPQQKSSASIPQQQPTHTSQYIDRHQLPPLHEGAMSQLTKPPSQHIEEPPSMRSALQNYASNPTFLPQSGLPLTPELIATLASLIPSGVQSSSSTGAELPLGSSSSAPAPFLTSFAPDQALSSQGWRQGHQATFSSPNHSREEQTVIPSQQLGYQVNTQAPSLSQFPAYSSVAYGPDNSGQTILANSQIQDSAQNVTQKGVSYSRPENNFSTPLGRQLTVNQQANQQFQLDASLNHQKTYGTGNVTDVTGYFHSPVFQQPKPSQSTEVQGMNPSPVNNNVNTVSDQVQQLQSALSGVGQGASDGDADKNQRYQSTLQFAASLLLQIQQQQQQGNMQAANGSGNQQ